MTAVRESLFVDRADAFLSVMAAIGVVGVLAFLVFIVGRVLMRPREAVAEGPVRGRIAPRLQWFEFLLGLLLLVAVAAVALWQLVGERIAPAGADDSRALIFFIIMAVVAGLGLIAFLVFLGLQAADRRRAVRRAAVGATAEAAGPDADTAAALRETPSPARLLGLLLFVVGFLLLNWIYVPGPLQLSLMLYVLYPAAIAVMLVLLFDKATRAWSVKSGAETFREWLLCDVLVLLAILGFLNLLRNAAAEAYGALFWDVLFLTLTVLTFWLADRQQTQFRFLVASIYFVLLPIQLLIWRAVQEVPEPEGLSWWGTVWPVFILAVIFLVLEIAALLSPGARERQGLPAFKDVVFYVAFAVLAIIAMPEAAT